MIFVSVMSSRRPTEETQSFHYSQYVDYTEEMKRQLPVPWKTIAYAFVLFLTGTLFLVFGSLLFTGMMTETVRWQPTISVS